MNAQQEYEKRRLLGRIECVVNDALNSFGCRPSEIYIVVPAAEWSRTMPAGTVSISVGGVSVDVVTEPWILTIAVFRKPPSNWMTIKETNP